MATRHISHLVDDVDGTVLSEGEGTQIQFSIDGRNYESDLSTSNADKFYSAMAPFVDAARRISGASARGPRALCGSGYRCRSRSRPRVGTLERVHRQ